MYRRRPSVRARTFPVLAALALSQFLAVGGFSAQASPPPPPAKAVAAAPDFTCLTSDDPYWQGCRKGFGEGWAAGAKCKPKPAPDYGDPFNRFRHGYADGYSEGYDGGLRESGCPPLHPIPADPPPPQTPQVPPKADPAREQKRAQAEVACAARIPATTTGEDKNRVMTACMAEAGFPDYKPPAIGDPATEQKRAQAEAACAARIPATTTGEDRSRVLAACMAEAGFPGHTQHTR
ncbi:hypothetical protein AB0M92_00130 [Streptomyces sp. NPDC051582]|uniref:hypothetical protein n=1 Tax=Streptomyces sp. NPDC051582 TaxID=3155167 RepID=UPI003421D007